jgi:hypothetical protein
VIPSGYKGWVFLERANPDCHAGTSTLTSVIFIIDSSGHGCTSTPLAQGPQILRFWKMDERGQKRKLHIGSSGKGGDIWHYTDGSMAQAGKFGKFLYVTEFFVGTEAEYQEGLKNRPKWWLERKP